MIRRGTKTRLAALLSALALLSAALAVASAAEGASASGQALPPPSAFALKASNGYSMFVLGAPADKGKPAAAVIFVVRKNRGAAYLAPAAVTETSIEADLGVLGEIAVTFHPSGSARTVRSGCGGKPVSFDSGSYEGTIDFHGEEGYTSVEATSAPGGLTFMLNILCPGASGETVTGGPFPLPGAELDIEPSGSPLGPHLKVVKNYPRARAHFEAGVSEKRNGISIDRFIGKVAPAHTFQYDPRVHTAILRPPAPFSGTAQFDRNAKPANRWTGDLAVDLPGRSDVKLTGGDLRASLAHAHWDWHKRG